MTSLVDLSFNKRLEHKSDRTISSINQVMPESDRILSKILENDKPARDCCSSFCNFYRQYQRK
ncbi:MAG: hypothetical protein AAFQ14_06700 [Cyanobacteria bacterium J06621_12]